MDQDFSVSIDGVDQTKWDAIVHQFADANLFQTWAYGVARSGSRLGHVTLHYKGACVAAVQVRFAGLSRLRMGVAYIRWGPLCEKVAGEVNEKAFRQIVRAIRNEYAIRRGLIVRMLPALCSEMAEPYSRILKEEGYHFNVKGEPYRTILMDLRPSLEELERGFHQKWRKHLNRARKNNLEIIEGEEDSLFDALGDIYREMLDRKQFGGAADINVYKRARQYARHADTMRVILCKSEGEIVAGTLFSTMGDTAVDLFRATSDRGIKTYGSYLLQWKALEHLRHKGCRWYNLNGINPVRNPGGYQFKSQLAGKNGHDVSFLGVFDAYPHRVLRSLIAVAEGVRAKLKRKMRTPAGQTLPPQEHSFAASGQPQDGIQARTASPETKSESLVN